MKDLPLDPCIMILAWVGAIQSRSIKCVIVKAMTQEPNQVSLRKLRNPNTNQPAVALAYMGAGAESNTGY